MWAGCSFGRLESSVVRYCVDCWFVVLGGFGGSFVCSLSVLFCAGGSFLFGVGGGGERALGNGDEF